MFQELVDKDQYTSDADGTSYVNRKKNRMDDPNFIPPELVEMLDPETQRVHANINPRQTPCIGKMKIMFEKNPTLQVGSEEPRYMIGPECKVIGLTGRGFRLLCINHN